MIEAGLVDGGYLDVTIISQLIGVAARIEERDPDIIVMDLGNPQRDFLEHMFRLAKALRKPIAMFVDQSSNEAMLEAMEAGVSAYVVDGLRKERVKPILDLAIARFRAYEKLRLERDTAVAELEDRKFIERAKSLLMLKLTVNEDEAYVHMRGAAMNRSVSIGVIAREIIDQAQLEQHKKEGV